MSDPTPVSFADLKKKEYKKCLMSPVYFMKKYVKIQHPIRGTIAFNLYEFQSQTLDQFHKNKFNIVLKSRQMGISTLVAAYSLWTMIFHKDKNILIISTKQEVSKELVSKVRFANDNLPSWLKVNCIEDNRLSLKLANGSHIRATSSSGDAGRSMAISLLVIDEAAFIDEIEDIWTSAWNTLSTGGNAIVLSTPNGVGNWFHTMWAKASDKENNFNTISLPWNLHPERTQDWRDLQTKELGTKQAGQECDCDFLASGDNVIDLNIVKWFKDHRKCDPLEIRGIDRGLWIWKYPDYTRSYIVTSDVARGDGSDFSACHVLDIVTLEQCAEYKGSIGTKDYGNFLVGLATEYNTALLIVERESVGWATLQAIIDRNYPNTFYSSTELKYVDVQRQLRNNYDSEDRKLVAGFSTNIKTRPLVISHLCQYFREEYSSNNGVKIYSHRTLAELETFIWKNGKAQAMAKFNDDLVMSLGIGLWVRDHALRLRQEGIDLTRATLEHTEVKKSEVQPFYKTKASELGYKSWQMSTGRQGFGQHNEEDIRWLLT